MYRFINNTPYKNQGLLICCVVALLIDVRIIHKHLLNALPDAAELLSNDVIVKVGIGPARNPFSNIITGN